MSTIFWKKKYSRGIDIYVHKYFRYSRQVHQKISFKKNFSVSSMDLEAFLARVLLVIVMITNPQ